MATYTYTDFKNAVNSQVHGKIGNLVSEIVVFNMAVRNILKNIDLRSTKRQSLLSPGIFGKIYNYPCPVDLKENALVDIARQVRRSEDFTLTSTLEFDTRKTYNKSMVAIKDNDLMRMLLIATELNTTEVIINDCESITSNGTWVASADASGLANDTQNYINGSGSIRFNTASGAATAVLTNSTQASVDIYDEYYNTANRNFFASIYIPDATLVTNFKLRIGSSASNYIEMTATTTAEGLAFFTGWNTLRFSTVGSTVGTPDFTAISYIQFIITKDVGKTAVINWNLDFINFQVGDLHNVVYYSKYLWQSSAGAYKENATTTTDLLVCDADEFNLITDEGSALASQELRNRDWKDLRKIANDNLSLFKATHPSDRMILETTYHRFGSIEGDNDVQIIKSLD